MIRRIKTFYYFSKSDNVVVRERLKHALRRSLAGFCLTEMWVTLRNGLKCHLSKDHVDDLILEDMVTRPHLYFPCIDNYTEQPGVVLIVGGHHGLVAAEAMRRYPDRRFIILEPHPDWCNSINRMLSANHFEHRAKVINCGLGNSCSTAILKYDADSSWGATTTNNSSAHFSLSVRCIPLDSALSGEQPLLIYCNAEGAEYSLVDQIANLRAKPRTLVLMVHPEYGDPLALQNRLSALGYRGGLVNDDHLRPVYHYFL